MRNFSAVYTDNRNMADVCDFQEARIECLKAAYERERELRLKAEAELEKIRP